MPDPPVPKVTVFVSSPKDVAPERGRVQAVTIKLNRECEGLVRFETVLWEEGFYTADKSFQPQILDSIAADIVVSIFWTRLGTELPADFPPMPNGKPYPSGTAYELLTALEVSKAQGVPDVYVFRKTADATLPTADAERRRQAQTQLDALEAFWSEWFHSERGEFKAAFQNFSSTDVFEQQIELLLRRWLEKRALLGPRIAWSKEKGAPFPGLAPFEAEHAAVFFGRNRVIDEARRQLAGAAERGWPFLLIVGASGSGKSSLARAGLIPRLTTPGVVASVDLWRVARMRPREGQAGPVMALANSLLATDALPELTNGDFPTAASLADNLRRGGASSVQPIIGAFARVAEYKQRESHADREPRPALLLLLDQFEELFAQRIDDAERAAFAESVGQLIATGRVWVVATLRADLYELLLKQPALKALKELGASLDLGPPGPAELAEIVRSPATAAGLAFETDPEKGYLDERLLADAKTADSLPLLQFTLRHLYERRVEIAGETKLTFAAYHQLGGLAGAIAVEAERAVSILPPDAVATLPRLLRRLAEPARDSKALTLREAPRAEIETDTSEVTLADALLTARILIARTDANGRPTERLAHDAVLETWPRAREAAQASRDFYRVRADVEDSLRRWKEHGRSKDQSIQPGVPLAEAERLVADFGAELPAEFISFVATSRSWARARQRLVAAAAIFFFVLAVAALSAGAWAYRSQRLASEEKDRADARLKQAQITQSRFLAASARQQIMAGDAGTAILLALDALSDDRPYVPEAEFQLDGAWPHLRERLILKGHEGPVLSAAFSPDGKRIVTASADRTARLWDAQTGKQIGEPFKGHEGRVNSAAFSPDGKRIVTASEDKTARLWDAETGAQFGEPLGGHTDEISNAVFSPDGQRIVTASVDATARLWDAKNGRQMGAPLRGHGKSLWSAAFSPDGQRVVTASGDKTARLWDAKTGKQIGEPFRGHEEQVRYVAFSPDGKYVITASDDKTARLWDVQTSKQIGEPFRGHDGYVFSAAFSPDGKHIVTASFDDTVRLWGAETGKQIGERLKGHEGRLDSARFSPDGRRIVTASEDKTARLWDAETGKQIGEPLSGHERYVFCAMFSPDGKRIVTASADKTARLWDAETGKSIGEPLRGHEDWVRSAAFSPGGKRIVTASHDKTARLWDAETGRQIGEPLKGHEGVVVTATFSADGKRVVTASGDKTARLWDAETGRQIGEPLKGHTGTVFSASFSPDGKRIVTASGDGTARLWDVGTGKQMGEPLVGPEGRVTSASFSADGKRIVTAHPDDQTARLWDAETGKQIGEPLRGHESFVWSAAFSPDGRRIITASWDKTARQWRVFANTQELVSYAKATVPRCLTDAQRTASFLLPDPPRWCIELEKWPYDTGAWKQWGNDTRAGKQPPRAATRG
jgi:WD40 repeat protein